MSKALILVCLLVPVLVGANGAGFTRFPAADGDHVLNLGKMRERMIVLGDGQGHYLVHFAPVPEFDERLYYGDGKTFSVVPSQSWIWDTDDQTYAIQFADPRFPARQTEFRYENGKYSVQCGDQITELRYPKGSVVKGILAKAKFVRSPFDWTPHTLARNDEGEYFYVDRGRWDDNSKRYRVFKGFKGDLKQQKLKNIVNDSEGEIFSTQAGQLRLVQNRTEYWWVSNQQKEKLTIVPPGKNIGLIYNDLGVYSGERFGTPCDDL